MTQTQIIHIAVVLLAAVLGACAFWLVSVKALVSGPVAFGVGLLVFGLVLLAVPA